MLGHRSAATACTLLVLGLTMACVSSTPAARSTSAPELAGRTLDVRVSADVRPEIVNESNEPLRIGLRDGQERNLTSAVADFGVASAIRSRLLPAAARHLEVEATPDGVADYELRVRVDRLGIASSDWTAEARFFLEARVSLVESGSATPSWASDVNVPYEIPREYALEQARGRTYYFFSLLDEEDFANILEEVADKFVDAVVERLGSATGPIR